MWMLHGTRWTNLPFTVWGAQNIAIGTQEGSKHMFDFCWKDLNKCWSKSWFLNSLQAANAGREHLWDLKHTVGIALIPGELQLSSPRYPSSLNRTPGYWKKNSGLHLCKMPATVAHGKGMWKQEERKAEQQGKSLLCDPTFIPILSSNQNSACAGAQKPLTSFCLHLLLAVS